MSGAQVIRIIDGRTNNLTFRCSGATAQNFTFATDGTHGPAGIVIQDGQVTPQSVTLRPNAATTSYALTFPPAQASVANQVLANDGLGALSWLDLDLEEFIGGAANLTTANRLVIVDGAGDVTQSANWTNIVDGTSNILRSDALTGCIQIGPDTTEGTWRICVDTANSNALTLFKYDPNALGVGLGGYVNISNFNEV